MGVGHAKKKKKTFEGCRGAAQKIFKEKGEGGGFGQNSEIEKWTEIFTNL